jgi:glycosyltransferase involved in cell wall biosynthesis
MKVLFDCPVPFSLAHGGQQIQIEQTQLALEKIGVTVEPLRWWDGAQAGDILHYFGRLPLNLLPLARTKGMKIVIADLLTAQGSRSAWQHLLHRMVLRFSEHIQPLRSRGALTSQAYQHADACVALTGWEAQLFREIYGVPQQKIHVVPNGVEDEFLLSKPKTRGEWLVCTAIITERKRVVELSEAAIKARTPLWIIGKPYAATDPYAQRFFSLAKSAPELIRYEGPIDERVRLAEIYRQARGFVLLSTMESLSLSALEAAACGCPLLLSELPWARSTFGEAASYCSLQFSLERVAATLRSFYDRAPQMPIPPGPRSWIEVARQLKGVYLGLLTTS